MFRKEIAYLIGNILIEIHIVDSPDVICMKCSHIYRFDLYLVCTEPFAIA